MSKNGKNLVTGIVIGAAAGFIAGIMVTGGKNKRTSEIKARISDLAADAQERIKALRAMAQRHETKQDSAGADSTGNATNS